MSVKAQWAFAGVLCLCTLVALWATAMSVRERKLAARRGERSPIQDGAPVRLEVNEARPQKLQLKPGQKVAVEHFSLVYRDDILSVTGSQDRAFVDFIHLKKGEQRGWQELRLTILEIDPSGLVVEAEIRPGAPSAGDGRYVALREGLRVEFDGKRMVTIASWDPARPELKLRIQQGDQVEEKTLGEDARMVVFGLTVGLTKGAMLLQSR